MNTPAIQQNINKTYNNTSDLNDLCQLNESASTRSRVDSIDNFDSDQEWRKILSPTIISPKFVNNNRILMVKKDQEV